MTVYVTAPCIANAIESLSGSRAKAGLLDFLIVKRTLKIKGVSAAPIAQSEQAFIRALDELSSCGSIPQSSDDDSALTPVSPDRPYINPFATSEAKRGYRSAKFKSNGTNTTIAGNPWQNVIELSQDDPRQASLKEGYPEHLEKLLLTSNIRQDKPHIDDVATWYFRSKPIVKSALDASQAEHYRATKRKQFVDELGLTEEEVAALFSEVAVSLDSVALSDVVADPRLYLPGITVAPGTQVVDAQDRPLSRQLVTALAAKRFVIFTGPSGTGKSRSALRLAEALQQAYASQLEGSVFQLVPVGPDWTSPKKLLGYRTPFGESRTKADGSVTNDSYEITESLRLILRASHPDAVGIPHLLIFDEMNLSHVEKYFAPFLSLIEASTIVDEDESAPLLDSHNLRVVSEVLESTSPGTPEAESAKLLVKNNQVLRLPPNLAFIGTVNVDETTYMFSPKVLDRAHVIEVDAPRPSTYLIGETQMEVGGTLSIEISKQLLQLSIDDIETQRFEGANPSTIITRAADDFGFSQKVVEHIRDRTIIALDGCHDLLSPVGFAFGFRTCKEVFGYLYVWLRACSLEGMSDDAVLANWEAALDRALLQKVLPRINGSRRILMDSLKATASFLDGGHEGSPIPAKYTTGDSSIVRISSDSALPLSNAGALAGSVRKLRQMNSQLVALGHTSFVL